MENKDFKVGAILENSLRQFTKIISIRRGVYGLSGWTSRGSAEKATVAYTFVNHYGLKYANAKVADGGKVSSASAPARKTSAKPEASAKKQTAAKKKAPAKKASAKKSTAKRK